MVIALFLRSYLLATLHCVFDFIIFLRKKESRIEIIQNDIEWSWLTDSVISRFRFYHQFHKISLLSISRIRLMKLYTLPTLACSVCSEIRVCRLICTHLSDVQLLSNPLNFSKIYHKYMLVALNTNKVLQSKAFTNKNIENNIYFVNKKVLAVGLAIHVPSGTKPLQVESLTWLLSNSAL